MASCRGINITNIRESVVGRFGPAGWDRVLAALPPADRVTISSILAVGWYELELNFRVMGAVVAVLAGGDLRVMRDIGRSDAERDLTGAQRLFLRLANPAYVLEKAGDYWSRFHDSGRWQVRREPTGATGTLFDFPVTEPAFCANLTGYIERMFELVGAKDVHVDHSRCRLRGDEACVFLVRWRT